MSSEIIKEFLVSLGFKVDGESFSKFNNGVAGATRAVATLGIAVTTAATAVVVAVEKIADQMESLYYSSQRTHATVENIEAVGYAARQVGGDANTGREAIEGLAAALRSNPGSQGLVNNLLGYNSAGQDTAKTLEDLAARFRQMPFYLAKQYAGMLGISENALMVLMRDHSQFANDLREMYARTGISADVVAQKSHNFMVELRKLGQNIEVLAQSLAVHLMPAATFFIKTAERGIEILQRLDKATSGWSTTIITTLVTAATIGRAAVSLFSAGLLAFPGAAIVAAIAAIGAAIYLLYDDYRAFKNGAPHLINWEEWEPDIKSATEAVKALMDAINDLWHSITGDGTGNLNGALKQLGHEGITVLHDLATTLVDIITVVTDVLRGDWMKAWDDAGKVLVHFGKGVIDAVNGVANTIVVAGGRPELVDGGGGRDTGARPLATTPDELARRLSNKADTGAQPLSQTPEELQKRIAVRSSLPQPVGSPALGLRQNNPGNLRHWGNAQESHGFAVFNTLSEGVSASAGNMLKYAQRGWDSITEIIKHWAPAGDHNNVGAYIADLVKKTGFSADQHLNLFDPEVLKSVLMAIFSHEQGQALDPSLVAAGVDQRLASRTLSPSPASVNNSSKNVTIQQDTKITVNGAGDPAAVGARVADTQGRTNSDLLRNATGAVR